MSRSSQNRRPDRNRSQGIFGITAPGSPGGGKRGRGGSNASSTAGSSRAGEILAPPSMRNKPGSGSTTSRKNNDGDFFTRQSPYSRPRYRPPF